jgi:hypothetical protein
LSSAIHRRLFLKAIGISGFALGCYPLLSIESKNGFEKLVSADKKLDAKWV